MSNSFTTQVSLPPELSEKLIAASHQSGRDINDEIIARLAESLAVKGDDADLTAIFDILERLSARNPKLRYSFAVGAGEGSEVRPAEIEHGRWTLRGNTAENPADALIRSSHPTKE